MTPTIDTLRQKLQQLQALHDSGALSAAALAEARVPLERELVAAVMQSDTPLSASAAGTGPEAVATAPRPSRAMTLVLSSAIVVLALVGYGLRGSPELAMRGPPELAMRGPAQGGAADLANATSPGDGNPPVTPEQVNEMVQKLADRLKEKPDDAVGWTMLARAYSAMGRYGEAVPAFKKALELAGDDASLLSDYADSLAAQNNGNLAGEPLRLVQKALALDPNNLKALALSGSAAFDDRDYATAVRNWEKVERALPPESQFRTQVAASIAQARELGGLGPAPAPASGTAMAAASPAGMAPAAGAASGAAAVAGKAVSGTVSLAPALAAQVSPTDTVFIVARAATGPRMPLAVLRKQVKDLPVSFTLDDSMAMAPTAKISDHPQVIVIARISKSGDAMPKPGDIGGQSAPVAPGVSGIAVEIRDVVPQ